MVLLVGIALGFAVAGMPRRAVDRPLAVRPAVTTTTIDPNATGVDATPTTTAPTTTTTAVPAP